MFKFELKLELSKFIFIKRSESDGRLWIKCVVEKNYPCLIWFFFFSSVVLDVGSGLRRFASELVILVSACFFIYSVVFSLGHLHGRENFGWYGDVHLQVWEVFFHKSKPKTKFKLYLYKNTIILKLKIITKIKDGFWKSSCHQVWGFCGRHPGRWAIRTRGGIEED